MTSHNSDLLKSTAVAVPTGLSIAGSSENQTTFRRPKLIIPVPTPSAKFQIVQAGVPDSRLTREATGILREFSTPLLFNHSHRVFFWANEQGKQA